MKTISLIYALFLFSIVAIVIAAGIEGKGKYVQCSPCAIDCIEEPIIVATPEFEK